MSFHRILQERLGEAERAACLRELRTGRGIDLCSNDYLGFGGDPAFRERVREAILDGWGDGWGELPLGTGGSRLLRGHLEVFDEVESCLAAFCEREAAILFPSGYQANVGILSAVLREGDAVFSDQRNHASIIDGIRLSRATKRIYPHRDLQALRAALQEEKAGRGLRVIVSESVFSMEGDQAPLAELVELAEEFSAILIIDEAHATGLWGKFDRGLGGGLVQSLGLSERVFATVHTGGKALGCGGAWVACDSRFKQYLINFSRPFIFSTAPMPLLAVTLKEAIQHWRSRGVDRAAGVHRKSERLQELARSRGISLQGEGPIHPVMIGSSERAVRVASKLGDLGYDLRAIRPPTVAEGSARLRLTVRSELDFSVLERFTFELGKVLEEECRDECGAPR